jgi:hypothetical protein
MEAEEHDDASPDDVEPGLLLLEQPAEPSSPAGPLLPLAPPLIHPVSDRTERLVGGSLRARKALMRRAIAGSASAVEWRRGQGSASDALKYRGRSSKASGISALVLPHHPMHGCQAVYLRIS